MPWSALPPHLNSPGAWNGKDDDDHSWTKWRKAVKGWFAFGPRAKEGWARFREWPITLVAISAKGQLRFENDYLAIKAPAKPVFFYDSRFNRFYLSRVQYWVDWDLQIQWPLFLGFHWKGWQGYIGFKRDADKVYWLALYFGRTWK